MVNAAVGTSDAGTNSIRTSHQDFSDAKGLAQAVDLSNRQLRSNRWLKADELDVNNGFRYVRANLTGTRWLCERRVRIAA